MLEYSAHDYKTYRGKCKEYVAALIKENPKLMAVRGHYYCPTAHTNESHWWCTDEKGEIIDPTKRQFLSQGSGVYTPFDGYFSCEECGKRMLEKDVILMGRFPVCSHECAARLVGCD